MADGRTDRRRWRLVLAVLLAAVVVVVLFRWVFPWVEERYQDPTVGHAPTPRAQVAAVAVPAPPGTNGGV